MRIGSVLIWIGVVLVATGVLLRWFPSLGSWFGHLPGDLVIRRDGVTIFVPFTSMIVLSLVISVVLRLLSRLR